VDLIVRQFQYLQICNDTLITLTDKKAQTASMNMTIQSSAAILLYLYTIFELQHINDSILVTFPMVTWDISSLLFVSQSIRNF